MRFLINWFAHPTGRLAAGLLAAAGFYATRIETRWLRVQRYVLPLRNLPPAFDGYRIVHLSDQHLGVPWTDRFLPQVVQAANRENADLIALTGDLITWSRRGRITPEVAAPLHDLRARDGVFKVFGNHDYIDPPFVRDLLAGSGITILQNAAHTLQRGDDRIALAGLDDVFWGRPDLPGTLAAIPPGQPVILLVHEPDFAPAAAAYPAIMLQLSGHSHGGQVRLFNRALLLPKYGRTHYQGLVTVRDLLVLINNGTGTGRFVIRWNTRPEITVLTLRCPQTSQPVV